MRRRKSSERGAVLLAVLVIIAVLAIIANAIARRQSYVWRLNRRTRRKEVALNAARSGAELALARAESNRSHDDLIRGTVGRGSFEACVLEGVVVSRGRMDATPNGPAAVVRVRFRRTHKGIEIVRWEED